MTRARVRAPYKGGLTQAILTRAERPPVHSLELIGDLARLRTLAETITTKAAKARLAREAQEHARLLGLVDEPSGSE